LLNSILQTFKREIYYTHDIISCFIFEQDFTSFKAFLVSTLKPVKHYT